MLIQVRTQSLYDWTHHPQPYYSLSSLSLFPPPPCVVVSNSQNKIFSYMFLFLSYPQFSLGKSTPGPPVFLYRMYPSFIYYRLPFLDIFWMTISYFLFLGIRKQRGLGSGTEQGWEERSGRKGKKAGGRGNEENTEQ
eukprot:Hpha_TRINITY_DN16059_c3_g3::TRINITY_DN16059_c3_g3_i1::g.117203::m.117203